MTRPDDRSACDAGLRRELQADPALAERWSSLPRRTLPPRATLQRAGEMARHAWLIERGLVRMYCASPEGLERNKSFHAEGCWVAGAVPPLPLRSEYAIESLEAVEAVEVSFELLDDLAQRMPSVRDLITTALSRVFARLAVRESELLLLDATDRYRAFLQAHGAIVDRLPQHQIASYLGITDVALSRVRSRLGMARRRMGAPPDTDLHREER